MSKKINKLLVVAHPDDETLFFGGLLLRNQGQFHVCCVTDGNADGQGQARMADFAKACKALGVQKFTGLHFPDQFHSRLDVQSLKTKLQMFSSIKTVYTHGPIGEYGHPHHQDVCLATHLAFATKANVWSVAHNCMPDKVIQLSKAEFQKKTKILREIYFEETTRFITMVPASFSEGYIQFELVEIEELHRYLSHPEHQLNLKKLTEYKSFASYLTSYRAAIKTRPF